MIVSRVILRPGRNCFFRPHPAWPHNLRQPFRPSKLVCQLSELFLHWENESDSLLFGRQLPENFLGNQACTSQIRLQVRTTTVSYEDFDQDTWDGTRCGRLPIGRAVHTPSEVFPFLETMRLASQVAATTVTRGSTSWRLPESHLFKQGKEKLRCLQLNRCQAVQRQARGQLRPIDDVNHCGQNNTKRNARVNRSIGGRRFGSPTRAYQRSWRPWSLARHGDSLAAWSSSIRLSSSWRSLLHGRRPLLFKSGSWCAVVQAVHSAYPEIVVARATWWVASAEFLSEGGPLLRRLRAGRNWCFGANNLDHEGHPVPTRRVGSIAKWWRKRSCGTLPPRLLALRASFAAPCRCLQKASFRPPPLLGFFFWRRGSDQVVVFVVQTGQEANHLRDRTLGQVHWNTNRDRGSCTTQQGPVQCKLQNLTGQSGGAGSIQPRRWQWGCTGRGERLSWHLRLVRVEHKPTEQLSWGGEGQPDAQHVRGGQAGREGMIGGMGWGTESRCWEHLRLRQWESQQLVGQRGGTGEVQPRREQRRAGEGGGGGAAGWEGEGRWSALLAWGWPPIRREARAGVGEGAGRGPQFAGPRVGRWTREIKACVSYWSWGLFSRNEWGKDREREHDDPILWRLWTSDAEASARIIANQCWSLKRHLSIVGCQKFGSLWFFRNQLCRLLVRRRSWNNCSLASREFVTVVGKPVSGCSSGFLERDRGSRGLHRQHLPLKGTPFVLFQDETNVRHVFRMLRQSSRLVVTFIGSDPPRVLDGTPSNRHLFREEQQSLGRDLQLTACDSRCLQKRENVL